MREVYTIGVDIGGTKINIGLIDNQGQVRALSSIATAVEAGYQTIANHIIDQIYAVLDQAGLKLADVKSLGFGIPGTVNSKEGVVLFAPNLQWQNIAFAQQLRAEFASPIFIGQDTHAAAWAEFLFGAGVGCQNLVCLTLGTGIGSGLIVNQQLYLGSLTYVGEVGHSLVELNGRPCSCGNRGCLEAYASGSALSQRVRETLYALRPIMMAEEPGF